MSLVEAIVLVVAELMRIAVVLGDFKRVREVVEAFLYLVNRLLLRSKMSALSLVFQVRKSLSPIFVVLHPIEHRLLDRLIILKVLLIFILAKRRSLRWVSLILSENCWLLHLELRLLPPALLNGPG